VNTTSDPLARLEAEQHQPAGARLDFQQQLADCTEALVAATEQIADAVGPVTEAFLQADSHTAEQWVAADDDVARRCRRLEEACYTLLARQSPVGGDLRRVVGILRSIFGVQRSSHLLRHVATSLQWVHPPALDEGVRHLVSQLGGVTAEVFAGGAAAWRSHDPLAANALKDADDQVDLLQKHLLTELYTGEQSVEEAVSLALLARYYERIADHGVELARQVAYFVTGERVED
jgi:phosphate transport system protein